jgi:hypothetical protein
MRLLRWRRAARQKSHIKKSEMATRKKRIETTPVASGQWPVVRLDFIRLDFISVD